MTLQTPDIVKAKDNLEKHNIPYFGYVDDGPYWKELFIHPKDAFGVLIQIAEFNADDWVTDSIKKTGNKKWKIDKKKGGYELHVKHPGGGTTCIDLNKHELKEMINDLENA